MATRSSSSGRSSTLSPALVMVSRKLRPAPARLRPGLGERHRRVVHPLRRCAPRAPPTARCPTSAATCTARRAGMSLYSFMGAPRVVGPHRGPGLDSHRAPSGRSRLRQRCRGVRRVETGPDNREGRYPQRGQEQRVPRRHHPRGGPRARPSRPRRVRAEGCRARLLDHRRGVRLPGRQDPRRRRRRLGRGGHGHEGQGAGGGGVPPPARGPDPVHLPPPRRRRAAHQGARRHEGHLDRLRDGAAALGPAAAALPDVRGRRAASPPRSARTR